MIKDELCYLHVAEADIFGRHDTKQWEQEDGDEGCHP